MTLEDALEGHEERREEHREEREERKERLRQRRKKAAEVLGLVVYPVVERVADRLKNYPHAMSVEDNTDAKDPKVTVNFTKDAEADAPRLADAFRFDLRVAVVAQKDVEPSVSWTPTPVPPGLALQERESVPLDDLTEEWVEERLEAFLEAALQDPPGSR